MRICIIYMSAYPWDVRVEKIGTFLRDQGHDVHILCRTTLDRPPRETIDGMRIERPGFAGGGDFRINRMLDLPLPINLLWYRKVRRYCAVQKIDLIMCRDIPLVLPALFAGRRLRIPVILDMAENYPAMFSDFIRDSRGLKKLYRFILKNPAGARWVEKRAIRQVDHLFVVVEEAKERLKEMGVDSKKVSVVSNTPPLAKADAAPFDLGEGFKLIYIGQLQESRGVGTAIEAFREIVQTDNSVHLYIGGKGEQEEEFGDRVRRYGLENNVHLLGWVDPDDVYRWIKSCDVGIVPLLYTRQLAGTIANKLFDFMLCGKPVLVSDLPPMKRIVGETGCGEIFRAGDNSDFARQMIRLKNSPDLAKMGENGRAAAEKRYNWETDCRIIAEVIDGFESRANGKISVGR
jgi:glycosyltransferase involved in cell wall biosynthesis